MFYKYFSILFDRIKCKGWLCCHSHAFLANRKMQQEDIFIEIVFED
jgi:hypothetical protein